MAYKAGSKSPNIFWLRASLSVVLVAILASFFIRPDFRQTLTNGLTALPLHIMGLLFILFMSMRAFQTIALRDLLAALGTRIRILDCSQLVGLKGIYNMGIAGGGVAAQLAQAKISLGIGAGKIIAATLLQAGIFISSLLLLFGLVLISFRVAPLPHQTMIAAGCFASTLAIAGLLMYGLRPSSRMLRIRPLKFIYHSGLGEISQLTLRSLIWRVHLYTLGAHITRGLRFTILLSFMASQVSLGFSMTAVLGADIVAQLPVTPAGIGTRELALSYFGESISLFDVFLAAAIIDRGAAICFNIVHGLFAFFYSLRIPKNPDHEHESCV